VLALALSSEWDPATLQLKATLSGHRLLGRLRTLVGDREEAAGAMAALPLPGWINGLAITPSASLLVVGVGQEQRLGRWERRAEGKTGIYVIPLRAGTA